MEINFSPINHVNKNTAQSFTQKDKIVFIDNPVVTCVDLNFEDLNSKNKYTKTQLKTINIYNQLWKELNLNEELQPPLKFVEMEKATLMKFDGNTYTIEIPKNSYLLELLNDSGIAKKTLRHEIKHVEQFQSVVRLLGANKTLKTVGGDFFACLDIEKTLGRITPNSPEGQKAQKYVAAFNEYVKPIFSKNIYKTIKSNVQYSRNLLEQEAKQAEKSYSTHLTKVLFSKVGDLLVRGIKKLR